MPLSQELNAQSHLHKHIPKLW